MAMIEARWTKHLRPATWLALLGIVAVIACVGGNARAADDEEDDSFDGRILRQLKQSLGVESSPGSIEYRERSPLVVPPSRDLPPPQSAAAEKNALPADLGISRPSEIAARRMGGGASSVAPEKDYGMAENPTKPIPMDLGKGFGGGGIGSVFKSYNGANEVGTFTAEPPRTSLTEPPPGYQTPSPAAPYGITSGGKFQEKVKDEGAPLNSSR
jgi:hypothetical protein